MELVVADTATSTRRPNSSSFASPVSSANRHYRKHQHVFLFLLLSFGIFVCQLYHGTLAPRLVPEFELLIESYLHQGETKQEADTDTFYLQPTIRPQHNETVGAARPLGACLMVKDDNDLLYEWLAYHFTTLVPATGHPFYVVIGSDIGSIQDPVNVLRQWKDISELRYWILQPDDFVNVHGNYSDLYGSPASTNDISPDERKKHHHHALIHRQKGFLTACSQLLQRHGAGWTLYADTDEFLALQPLTVDDSDLTIDGKGHRSITNTSYQIRQKLAETVDDEKSILEILSEIQDAGHIDSCYTIPRLLVGALENRTCPSEYGIDAIQQLAASQLSDRYSYMSTLRFFQHATKGDFARSKYGKVLMDLSRIGRDTLEQPPRNIHRPYAQHCGPAGGAHFPDAFAFLMHYIGSWERYTSRTDERRNRQEWEERAFVDDGHALSAACTSKIPHWYPRFVQRVGQDTANALLGVE